MEIHRTPAGFITVIEQQLVEESCHKNAYIIKCLPLGEHDRSDHTTKKQAVNTRSEKHLEALCLLIDY